MSDAPACNLPDVLTEVTAAFERYERALVGNDIATLDALFHAAPTTVRYGATENLYGIDEIRAFRAARSPAGLARRLRRTVITSWGRDFAVASTEFIREGDDRIGRQQQTWVRFPDGWKVVAAQVSWLASPA
ncbi:oxalurate catabolism protein HpxZ [Derxia gummosa]|uniref:Oxalurate catabolism protein HpxZ n=1 Tax=Derxia gummosa DSM 723 TaxID=1121388 RepID=A0A8B6X685_9BURK|nr:oxalurate catabolism protein HpxZ [Derxia gummosa]